MKYKFNHTIFGTNIDCNHTEIVILKSRLTPFAIITDQR